MKLAKWPRALLCMAAGAWGCAWPHGALANGGSYAATGTGTYAQSLWWLDLAGYSDTTAALTGQPFTFTLPNGAGTFTTTINKGLGLSAFAAVAEPAASGGAFGHGAYGSLTGTPILYTTTLLLASSVTLNSLVMHDASGNARTFILYAADGENTTAGESLSYATSSTWSIVDTVNYYAGYNGVVPATSTVGTTVTETGSGTSTFNASLVLKTANPTTVTASVLGTEGVLFAVSLPTVTFNVVTAGRSDPSDEFTAAIGYTSPAAAIKTAGTAGTGVSAATGAISVIGTNSITVAAGMLAGSASPLAYYGGSMACSNTGPGAASYGGTNTVLPNGAGTSFTLTPQTGDAITCTLTLTPIAQTLNGTVYGDANHNATLDGAESGIGITGLYMKLAALTGGVCQTPATAAAPVNAGTGAYSIPSVAAGTYCLTLTNNSTLANTSAYRPAGWIGTDASSGVRQITSNAVPSPAQNIGLYNGSSLSLTVFGDTGVGSGIPHDGAQNGGEPGLGAVAVAATVGGSVVATATTGGNGGATLWLPASISGTVTLSPSAPGGDLATGGSAGTTSGSYTRPTVVFTYAAGSSYSGVAFGLIAPDTLTPNGAQSAQPGSVVFYPHTFFAGSAGQLTFSTGAVATPTLAGWTETLYLDSACTGHFASADPVIGAAISVTAGQQVCALVKEFVPAGAALDSRNLVTVNAAVVYGGSAAPANVSLSSTDLTTVSAAATQLTKQVQNVTQAGSYTASNTALPGNTLQYQLTIVNQGSTSLSTVVINDSTPANTTFLSAACPGSLPSSLTGCTLSAQPSSGATGAVQWTFAGALAPGTQTTVTYQVVVTP